MFSHMAMIITLCAVLFVFSYIPLGSCCPAFSRPIGNMTPDYNLLVGEELVLNCSLHSPIVDIKDGKALYLNSSSLLFKFSGSYITENVKELDEHTIQLRIQNASIEDGGKYYCFVDIPSRKLKVICTSYVAVGYMPLNVEDFSCKSTNLEVLRCSWTPPKNPVATKYTIEDDIYDQNNCYPKKYLARECPRHMSGNDNSCEWTLVTSPPYKAGSKVLCFHLEGKNSLGVSMQQFTIDHYAIVIPNKTNMFNIQNYTANSLIAFWLPPDRLSTKDKFPPGLTYEVQYKPVDSSRWQVIQLDDQTRVNITNLIPHTDYNLRLRCRSRIAVGDGFWSEFATTSLLTYSDIPYKAPELTPGLFETRQVEGHRNITLHWKGVPRHLWNGKGFRYIIDYRETYLRRGKRNANQRLIVSNEKSSAVFTGMDINTAYEFTLYSANEEGQSRNFSTIKVHKKMDMPHTPTDIRALYLGEGNYNVSWESPRMGRDPIEGYTIFWCIMLQPGFFPCRGPLSWTSVDASEKTVNISLPNDDPNFQFAVSANTKYSSSGLEWAQCVAPLNGVLNKINTVIVQPLSSTSLKVIWELNCPVPKHLIKGYRISYCRVKHGNDTCSDAANNVTINKTDADNYILEKLEPFSQYRVVVFAKTNAGLNEGSVPRFAKTRAGAPSDPPQHFSVFRKTDTTAELRWHPPLKPNGKINYYKITLVKDTYQKSADVEAEELKKIYTAKLEKLTPYTNYTVELRACVNYECSPGSIINFTTEIGVPGPMKEPLPLVYNRTFVQLSWISPLEPNGPVDLYVLYMQWESEDKLHTQMVNVTGLSYDLDVICPADQKAILYSFSIQAVNMKDEEVLIGNRSNSVQRRLCYSSKEMELGVIIGCIVGGAAILACVIIALYFFARWMKKKVDTIKDIKVQLPLGLETPQGNPLNSYENFKNGLMRKPSDSNLSPKTFYGRLNSYASDESDPKDRNDPGMTPFGNNSQEALIHKTKELSDGKTNNNNANIGKGHDSISSSLTTRTQLSSDSGAETDVQAPPSPESDNVPLGLSHTSPQPSKSSLPKVTEAHSCDSKDSGLEKEEGGSEKESDVSDPNQYTKFARYLDNPNHPYNRRQVSEKGPVSQQLPYSKFGVNMPGVSGYVPLSSTLALMPRSLANSEPSVIDAETMNNSSPGLGAAAIVPAPPYSKYGIGRSLGQSLNMPVSNDTVKLGTGYSKCGVGHDMSWLQQPRSPYIAANIASALLGSDTPKEKQQLNIPCNNLDLKPHSPLSPILAPPSCSSSPRNKGYVSVENMSKPNISPYQQVACPSLYSIATEGKRPLSKGYVSVQDAKNMLSEDRKLPHPSETKDQVNGIPGYSKFDIQCDRLQNTPDIETLDPVLTGTKPKAYPNSVHQTYVPYHNPSFDVSPVNMPFSSNDHVLNGNLNGDLSALSNDIGLENDNNEYELDIGNHSPSKYLPQSKICKPASEPSNGYVTMNTDSSVDAIKIVPTDSQLCPSLTDTAV